GQLDRLLRRVRRKRQRDSRTDHSDRRHSRQDRDGRYVGVSQNDSAGAVMAQLTAQVVSFDDEFKRQVAHLLRACGVPVGIVEGRSAEGTGPDLVVVDIRADASSGMAAVERLRSTSQGLAIFAVAAAAEPELILQAMRA